MNSEAPIKRLRTLRDGDIVTSPPRTGSTDASAALERAIRRRRRREAPEVLHLPLFGAEADLGFAAE